MPLKWKSFREVKVVCFGKLAMHVTVLIQYQSESGFPFFSQAAIKIFVLITKVPRSLFSVACMAVRIHKVRQSTKTGPIRVLGQRCSQDPAFDHCLGKA